MGTTGRPVKYAQRIMAESGTAATNDPMQTTERFILL